MTSKPCRKWTRRFYPKHTPKKRVCKARCRCVSTKARRRKKS